MTTAIPDPASLSRTDKAVRKLIPYLEEIGWIRSRVAQSAVDHAGCPIPWYSYAAIDFLRARVRPNHRVFEFGSGNSTHWWAEHAKQVTAVEHDPDWAKKVSEEASENIQVLEVPLQYDSDYCRTPLRTGERYEILVIDGRDRTNCALQCVDALTEDGVVIWDDSQRSRYGPGLSHLEELGFRRIPFTSLGPISHIPCETSVIYRPRNCLGI